MVDVKNSIVDAEVAVTGRLASMTRAEAVSRIEDVRGRYVPMPRSDTRYLVVGCDGAAEPDPEQRTRSLELAVRLREQGAALEIVSEEAFVDLLKVSAGDSDPADDADRLYTIGQLSRILSVDAAEIRSWMRRGFVTPARMERRLAYFDFHQVANARALVRLLADGATPAALRDGLRKLHGWLSEHDAQLRLLELGDGQVLVRLADGHLAEPNGQLRLDFEGRAHEGEDVSAEPRSALPSMTRRSQTEWFVEGVQAEESGDLVRAADAYHEALLAGDQRAEICFNLGNVLHALRRRGEAAQRFMQSVEIEPHYVEAWNNLGNTLAELGRGDRALVAYHRALETEPHYADAHFNLAATLEGMGRNDEASQHWEAYLRQDPNSPDADFVRNRLKR